MDDVFFKIIIPNYNNMAYIKKCLDSILEQTFQNFKIIIVDGMSTDLSDRLCEIYVKKYPNKIICLSTMKKYSVDEAIEIGLSYKLKSKYVLYVDPANYFNDLNHLQLLHDEIESKKISSDILKFENLKNENVLVSFKNSTSNFFDDKLLDLNEENKELETNNISESNTIKQSEPLKSNLIKQSDKVFFKIIIPNYNNMAYIKKCLDSILEQTFQDFKIIVVDDLSTDGSDKFCEMYARKYPNKIIYIKMKDKGHEGGCRNIGIDYKLKCNYYMFIDSDDWLYNNLCLKKLYDKVKEKHNPDILIYCLTMLSNKKYKNIYPPKFDWSSNNIAFKYSSACTKIVKYNKIQYFLTGCDHAADTYYSMKLFNQHPSIAQINDIIYVYNRNNNSVTLNGNYVNDTEIFYRKFIQLLQEISEKNVHRAMLHRIMLYLEKKINY